MSLPRRSFLKQGSLAGLGIWLPVTRAAAGPGSLPRRTPESQEVNAQKILDFLDAAGQAGLELHSFMMLRHGQVVAEGWWEPYGPDRVHTLYSLSKSFTSTAVGFAVAEGRLQVTDQVISFFPGDLPAVVSDNLGALRVRDLLTMSTGQEKEPTQACVKSEDWVRTFLSLNFLHPPGTQFMYNSAATYMCSAIVQKLTGQTLLQYLGPRLFEPLGISGMKWELCPRGINTGGWGLSLQTEALAKFGQFLLQKGSWQGRQLLPAGWVEEATRFHIQQPGGDKPGRSRAKNDWLQGYGYQFWRCQGTAFRGDGAFGQFAIVMPAQDAVIVMTSENRDLQGQLDLVWQHLLPAFDGRSAVPADLSRLRKLRLAPPTGLPPAAEVREGERKFLLETNEFGLKTISFRFGERGCTFMADSWSVECGWEDWRRGETNLPITPPRLITGGKPPAGTLFPVAAHAAWTGGQTLVLTWRYFETPHRDTLTCEFRGDGLTITLRDSITAMNPKAKDKRAPLVGKAVV